MIKIYHSENFFISNWHEEESIKAERLSLKCPKNLSNELWQKISSTSKEHLSNNNFVFPNNLGNDFSYYHYIKAEGKWFIIDKSTLLENNNEGVFLGQNLNTGDFVECKVVSNLTNAAIISNSEIITSIKLKRLEALLFDHTAFFPEDRNIYMAKKLITNGVSLDKYDWTLNTNSIQGAINLAISFLDELNLFGESKVARSYSSDNIIIDLNKQKVIINVIDNEKFSNSLEEDYLNSDDLKVILQLLPKMGEVGILKEIYSEFMRSLKHDFLQKNEINSRRSCMKISELKTKLTELENSFQEHTQPEFNFFFDQ